MSVIYLMQIYQKLEASAALLPETYNGLEPEAYRAHGMFNGLK